MPVQGGGWPAPLPAAQGTGHPSIAGPLTHAHTLSHWHKADTPIHLMCTALECVGKRESLEKTQADMGPQLGIDVFVIIIVMK